MRISQAYLSKSISDFAFLEAYQLEGYNNRIDPCLFIGCYRYEDKQLIHHHVGPKLILWTGQDALDYDWQTPGVNGAQHFTAHPKIFEFISKKGFQVKLIPPINLVNKCEPQILGTRIYAYCPESAKEYHGFEYIQQLREMGYEVLVGDGRHSQIEWKYVKRGYYDDAYVGLCLSSFAGGAGSVIEMGLRGMNVITNVLNLPNCQHWETLEDIVYLIEENKKRIGIIDDDLAQKVFNSLDHKNEWLNI
jgi:hypothetical protein